jgi:hypothetical protein
MDSKRTNKTLRKSSTKKPALNVFSIEESEKHLPIKIEEVKATDAKTLDPGFFSFLQAETNSALKKPWLRLERGIRIQKFRQFAETYNNDIESDEKRLTSAEKDLLIKYLVSVNDAKLLNSKQSVLYDSDEGLIKDIKGLKMIRSDDLVSFKIEASRPTKRSKPSESKIELE